MIFIYLEMEYLKTKEKIHLDYIFLLIPRFRFQNVFYYNYSTFLQLQVFKQ